MKIRSHILKVSDEGDKLAVEAQGFFIGSGEWTPISFKVPASRKNKRAYHVGRGFDISINLLRE